MNLVSNVDRVPVAHQGLPCSVLKIGILEEYQGVAHRLADWSSLDADVRRGSKP